MIYEGFLRALGQGAPRESAGILVDEESGADVARGGHAKGVILTMPVEASTEEELEETGGVDSYDHSLRPQLMIWAIAELQAAGIEPDVWKIEGIDRRRDCDWVAAQARAEGPNRCAAWCWGAAPTQQRVEHWLLREGAGAEGFAGFAIGRTIWFDTLKSWLSGDIDRAEAARRIAAPSLHAIVVYENAASGVPLS